jgi:hypothetical protein
MAPEVEPGGENGQCCPTGPRYCPRAGRHLDRQPKELEEGEQGQGAVAGEKRGASGHRAPQPSVPDPPGSPRVEPPPEASEPARRRCLGRPASPDLHGSGTQGCDDAGGLGARAQRESSQFRATPRRRRSRPPGAAPGSPRPPRRRARTRPTAPGRCALLAGPPWRSPHRRSARARRAAARERSRKTPGSCRGPGSRRRCW